MPPISPTPLLVKPGKRLGEAGKTRFFGHKYLADQLRGVYFGPHKEGIGAHSPDIFTASSFHVFREIVDFRQNFGFFPAKMGQGTVAKILSLAGLGGPRLAHSKNWPPPVRFLRNLGKTFWGWSTQGGLGPKFKGPPSNA